MGNLFSTEMLMTYVARILVIVLCTPIHELAHGWVALKLGDDTAKYQGRLTLNPIKHLHPIGSTMLLLTGYGFANPVPVNPARFRQSMPMRKGMAIVAAAGPISNIILALLFMIISKFLWVFPLSQYLLTLKVVFRTGCYINIGLAVFNMIPIPPFDGSRIFALILPQQYYFTIMKYEQYIMMGLLILFITPIGNIVLYPLGLLNSGIYFSLDKLTFFMNLIPKVVNG